MYSTMHRSSSENVFTTPMHLLQTSSNSSSFPYSTSSSSYNKIKRRKSRSPLLTFQKLPSNVKYIPTTEEIKFNQLLHYYNQQTHLERITTLQHLFTHSCHKDKCTFIVHKDYKDIYICKTTGCIHYCNKDTCVYKTSIDTIYDYSQIICELSGIVYSDYQLRADLEFTSTQQLEFKETAELNNFYKGITLDKHIEEKKYIHLLDQQYKETRSVSAIESITNHQINEHSETVLIKTLLILLLFPNCIIIQEKDEIELKQIIIVILHLWLSFYPKPKSKKYTIYVHILIILYHMRNDGLCTEDNKVLIHPNLFIRHHLQPEHALIDTFRIIKITDKSSPFYKKPHQYKNDHHKGFNNALQYLNQGRKLFNELLLEEEHEKEEEKQ